jgi:hypothetical protein
MQRDDAASTPGARGITVADLNRDGWLDIATARSTRMAGRTRPDRRRASK